jgi:hypothetical protein
MPPERPARAPFRATILISNHALGHTSNRERKNLFGERQMTKSFTKILATAITAAMLGLAASPAMAGGQIAIGFSPSDPDQAQALGTGLKIFSLFKGLSSTGANAYQNGSGNGAGFNQNGSGNHGLIYQNGNGHNGTISQNGNNNSCGLFQFGQATNAQCVQNGSNQAGITTVFGF